MLRKITLENFMAHVRTEVELGPGVTALTGPNNTGKSAIVEALRCVATNPTPKHFIRHGTKEARVSVELEDGTRIVWVRKKRSAGYELYRPGADEPEEYWKLGRGVVPEDVREILRLDPVELDGGERIDVHIGNQREPVFLLNLPDRAVADFLASSTEGAHLLTMQGALKRRVMEARKEVAGREARLRNIASELDALSPLPELTLKAEVVRELEERIQQLQTEIPAFEALLQQRAALEKQMERLQEITSVLDAITPPPEMNEIRTLQELLKQQVLLGRHLAVARKSSRALSELSEPPVMADVSSLKTAAHGLQRVAADLDKARERATLMEGLNGPPELFDEVPLRSCSMSLARLGKRSAEARQELERVEQEMEMFRSSLEEQLSRLGRCPTCGGELDSEEFLTRGCTHDA